MTVQDTGNVGIGTSDPTVRLQVDGGGDASLADGSGYLVINNEGSTNIVIDNNEIMARNNGATSPLCIQNEGGITEFGGNVGIGTSDPAEKLEVVDGRLQITNSIAGDAAIRLKSNGSIKGHIYYDDSETNLTFAYEGIGPQFTLKNNGNVGIGSNDPGRALQIDSAGPVIRLRDTNDSGSGVAAYLEFYGSNNARTGYVGDESSGDGNLHIVSDGGNVYSTGTSGSCWVNYGACSSDIRLKQDIEPVEGSLDKLMSIRGVSFEWKKNPGPHFMGFIAQEVEKQFPVLVNTDKEGYKPSIITASPRRSSRPSRSSRRCLTIW